MSTLDSIVTRPRPRRASDYADLMTQVRQAGLLDRRTGYYAAKIAILAGFLVAGWTAFVMLGASWWQLATAVYLAVVFTLMGFLAHDAGHRQIFRTRRANELVGLIAGNLAIGLAFGWWVDKHHRHHAHPNQEGLDPDIGGENLVFTRAQARGRRGFGRLVARHQDALFFPMLLLLALNLRVSGVKAMIQPGYRNRVPEALLFGLHIAAYLAAVLLVLTPLQALAFVAVHQGLLGLYLGCGVRPQPQRHADPVHGRRLRLPAPPGPHRPQRTRRAADRPAPRRAQLPDRTPPVPQHAPPEPAPRTTDRPRPLPRATACRTSRPG